MAGSVVSTPTELMGVLALIALVALGFTRRISDAAAPVSLSGGDVVEPEAGPPAGDPPPR
jgi:hypothetical protein